MLHVLGWQTAQQEEFDYTIFLLVMLLPLQAIAAAHEDLGPAAVSYASGQLLGANINRSPTAYLANPAAELAAYQHDVDKTMELLRIKALSPDAAVALVPTHLAADHYAARGQAAAAGSKENSSSSSSSSSSEVGRGMISWFPVHCTSMNNTNPYVSGDNKGAAAQLVEKAWSKQQSIRHAADAAATHSSASMSTSSDTSARTGRRSRVEGCSSHAGSSRSWLGWYWQLLKCLVVGQQPAASTKDAAAAAAAAGHAVRQAGSFVAAFAQSSVGDTSPNVQGAFCLDTGAGQAQRQQQQQQHEFLGCLVVQRDVSKDLPIMR
jgi:neutral ceramidase